MSKISNITISLVSASLLFSGCADPQPNFYNGKYYMIGDENCVKVRPLSDSRIMCANQAGQEKGYREAMTDQQISMYQHNQQIKQQKQQEFDQSLRNFSNQLNYNNQQMMNRNNTYKVRTVGPYGY